MAPISMFLLSIVAFSYAAENDAGPFHLKVVNVTDCGKSPDIMHFELKAKSHNESSDIIDGTVALPMGFNDDMKMTIDVDEWRKDSWVENVYSFKFKSMCTALKDMIPETFSDVARYLKIEDKCPIAEGTYVFKNFLLTLKPTVMKEIKYATYKTRAKGFLGDKLVGCFETILIATPRKM